jgi:protein required for attachment to host cells
MQNTMPITPHHLDSIYIVVADHCSARFFTAAVPEAPLVEIEALVNPQLHQHEGGLVSDHAGSLNSSTHRGGHTAGRDNTTRHQLSERFASEVCKELSSARISGRCTRIHLIAEPGFLGLLRHEFDEPTRRLVASELPKDVVRNRPDEIRQLLPARL